MPKIKKAAKNVAVIYARFSSDNQREESIVGQLRECRAFAAREGLTVVHEYIDRAMSARTDRRPDFLSMIEDSKLGLFSYVIVYQLDRFSRDRYDSAIYKRALKLNGVRVLSARENISTDPSGILIESFLEGNAEYFSADLAVKVRRGMKDTVLSGKWPGGYIPFGFALDKEHHLIKSPITNAALEQIIQMFLQGATEFEIRTWLTSHNFTQPNGKPFRRNFLVKLLQNTLLKGLLTWGEEEYPNFVESTVTEVEFDKIQRVIQARKKGQPLKRLNLNYKLVGKLYCSCGLAMVGTYGTSRHGYKYHYYICSSKTNKKSHKHMPCGAKNLRCDAIESLVLKTTARILSTPETLHFIAVHAVEQWKKLVDDTAIVRIKSAISQQTKKLNNYVKAIEQGVISETITNNITVCEASLKKLRFDLMQEEKKKSALTVTEDMVEFYLTQWLPKQKNGEFQLNFFSTFIRRIIVFPDCIEVQYNYHMQSAELPVPAQRIEGSDSSLLVNRNALHPNTFLFNMSYFSYIMPRAI